MTHDTPTARPRSYFKAMNLLHAVVLLVAVLSVLALALLAVAPQMPGF